MTVIYILGTLLIALLVIVPLIERSNFQMSTEQMGKFGRWILPLLVISIVVQIIMYYSR